MTLTRLDALPAIPAVVRDILQVLNRPEAGVADVSRALALDPGMTGRLIGAANAAFFSGLRPIYSLDEAVLRLGLDRVRSMALTVLLGNRLNPRRCPAFSSKTYWSDAMKTADCAAKLAVNLPLGEVGRAAYLAGLLHNIGLLVNAYAFPEDMQAVLEARLRNPELSLAALQRERLGFDHFRSGAELLRRWELPPPVIAAVGQRPCPEEAGEYRLLVQLTAYAARWAQTGFRVRPTLPLELSEDRLQAVGESCQREREQVEALAFMLCSAA